MTRNILSLLILTFCFNGCAWFKANKTREVPPKIEYTQTVKLIDQNRLKEGGKLLLVAFKPGPEVAANEEYDQIAFMILKGIADELTAGSAPFDLLSADRAKEAELILEGWINSTGQNTIASKILWVDERPQLVIEGTLLDRKTGNKILVFTNARKTEGPEQSVKDLGLKLGTELGEYIIQALE